MTSNQPFLTSRKPKSTKTAELVVGPAKRKVTVVQKGLNQQKIQCLERIMSATGDFDGQIGRYLKERYKFKQDLVTARRT